MTGVFSKATSLRGAQRRGNPVLPKSLAVFWIASLTLAMTVFITNPVHAAWYNPSWPYRVKLTVDADQVNGDLANFPVYVDLNDLNGSGFFTNVLTGGDIRVTKSDGSTEIAREVVSMDKTAKTGELHFIANGTLSGTSNSDWYLYYGNPSAIEPSRAANYGSENVWSNNYVGVWHMNEDPMQETSRHFNSGVSEYFTRADNTDLSTGDIDFTIAAWVYLDSAANFHILGKWSDTLTTQFEYILDYVTSTNRFRFAVSNDGSTVVAEDADSLGVPSTNTWYFIVAWHDSTANTINIQINDGSIDSSSHTTGINDDVLNFRIGSRHEGDRYMNGRIARVGYWKRTLTAAEKTFLYNNGIGHLYNQLGQSGNDGSNLKTSLISYWDLNEVSGNAIDAHGSNDLTDTNSVDSANAPYSKIAADFSGNKNPVILNGYSDSEELLAWTGNTPDGSQELLTFDQSSNKNDGTLNNFPVNPRSTTSPAGFNGNSMVFDGVNDYISINDDAAFDFGTGAMTLAAWIKTSGTNVQILNRANTAGADDIWAFKVHSTGQLRYEPAATVGATSTAAVNDNAWHHVVVTRAVGGAINMYIDGGADGSGSNAANLDSNKGIDIGRRTVGTVQYFAGNIDEVHIYNDVLSTNEMTYLRTNGASGTDPGTTNLVSKWNFDESNLRPHVNLGAGQSIELDGTDDYLSVTNDTSLDVTSAFSLSAWFYQDAVSTSTTNLIRRDSGDTYALIFDSNTSDLKVRFKDSTTTNHFGTAVTTTTGQWNHVVGLYDGSDLKLYINGTLRATDNVGSHTVNPGANDLIIGRNDAVANRYFNGKLDDIRVYNDALNENEISYLYNDGSTGHNPGTNNLIAYWSFDDGRSFIKDSTPNRNHGLSNGIMTNGDLITGKTGKAIDFDGSDDYINISTPLGASNSQDLTYSYQAWISTDNNTPRQTILGNTNYSGTFGTGIDVNSGSLRFIKEEAGQSITSAVSNSTFYHALANYDNGSNGMELFVDGASQGTTSSTKNDGGGTHHIGASNTPGDYFNGLIDEVRISSIIRSANWVSAEYNNQNSSSSFYSTASQESGPLVTSFSPVDNGDQIAVNSNLVINFDRNVDIQTGNIYIRKTLDDSLVESIDITSGAVTGNGTNAITINPNTSFPKGHNLYINIDGASIADSNGNPYTGISNNGTWSFNTTGLWDSGAWSRRIPITVKASQINGDLSNFPVYVDLGDLPAAFFDDVAANGADLRVTKSDGFNQVAREVVYVDKTANAGELHFVANGNLSSAHDTTFYLYYGNSSATEPAANSTYGSQNTWANGYIGVWHIHEDPSSSNTLDSSSSGNDGTPTGSLTLADLVNGQVGKAINFDAVDEYINVGNIAAYEITNNHTWTVWANITSNTASHYIIAKDTSGAGAGLGVRNSSGDFFHESKDAFMDSTTSPSLSTWYHLAATWDGTTRKLYVNKTEEVSAGANMTSSSRPLLFGSTNFGGGNLFNGIIDEVRISDSARSANWISAEYNNQNSPSSFIDNGSIESRSIGANWLGEAWSKRTKITINATQVNGDLSNFPIYINLADLSVNGDAFFTNVDSNGADIRITKSDGITEVAREVVSVDKTNNGGEMYFIANGTLSGSIDSCFYIYYGNPFATEPAANSTYGSQNVWTNNYVGVWHLNEDPNNDAANSILDSSSVANHFTPNGAMLSSDLVNGKLGKSIDFDGVNDHLFNTSSASYAHGTGDFTWSAWINPDDFGGYNHILAVDKNQSSGALKVNVTDGKAYYFMSGFSTFSDITTADLVQSNWNYIVFTRASNVAEMLLNGSSRGTKAAFNANFTNHYLSLGSGHAAEYTDGKLDEARVSSVARSADWLKTEYNNQNSPSTFYTVGEETGGLFDWNLF